MKNPENLYCKYCFKRGLNKKILNIDEDKDVYMKIVKGSKDIWLEVQFDLKDNDGYQAVHFFNIKYCPMCGRKLEVHNDTQR